MSSLTLSGPVRLKPLTFKQQQAMTFVQINKPWGGGASSAGLGLILTITYQYNVQLTPVATLGKTFALQGITPSIT
jgi:hypothetical protein